MPAYLAMNMAAISASFIGLSVISERKTMVGKPRGRNFLFRAVLRMIAWSSNAWRVVLEPESRTMLLMPAAVSFSVISASSSTLEAFTATGHELSLAISATRSRVSLVAA
ncbi:hypothetical protein ES703_80845 [subsurface metagenome]